MKKTKILYWVFTVLFCALMLFSAIPNIMSTPESIDFVSGKLGFPAYFIPFIGVAKFLGVVGILVPGFPRIKEWAYAGLTYDLLGATYSVYAVSTSLSEGIPMLFMLLLPAGSYFFYHRKLKERKTEEVRNFATA
jgi:hypothetical protein